MLGGDLGVLRTLATDCGQALASADSDLHADARANANTDTDADPDSKAGRCQILAWCLQFDAPGNDNQNLNEEYVCFQHASGTAIDMTGWHVKDAFGHEYTFPAFLLATGARVKVHTGCADNTATDVYWCQEGAIWNNDRDTVYLCDAAWALVGQYSN